MVLGSSELVVILVLALLLFGPQKLPELARALGHAVGEYHKAAREFEEEKSKITGEIDKETSSIRKELTEEAPSGTSAKKNSAEIKKIARGMGITTVGKDDSTLLKEIDTRMSEKKAYSQRPAARTGVTRKPASFQKGKRTPAAKPKPAAKAKPEGGEGKRRAKASTRTG